MPAGHARKINLTPFLLDHGYWYARSPEFMQTDTMQWLRWMRVPGDTVFFLGAVALVWFVAGLKTGHSFRKTETT